MNHSPGFLKLVDDAKTRVREIIPEEVRRGLARAERITLIDIREDHEWEEGHICGAIHLGRGILERDIEQMIPQQGAKIILYCGGGFRSALAADNLQKMGYVNVFSMAGGWRKWRELAYPVE